MARVAVLAAVAALVAGCATTSGLEPTESRSGFDGARVVDIAPHGAACDAVPCLAIGAQWNSKTADAALLHVRIVGPRFLGITGVELAVDGSTTSISAPGPSSFEPGPPPLRNSTQTVPVQLQQVRAIAAARKAWIRVRTPEGYIEAPIVDSGIDSKALHALRRFLAAVDSTPPR